ncbi:MAG: hypothetical protein KAU94_06025 [Verrucomicrobia bacterium]|nr:hypothetical protein [Verrucomicrobiota bacterium]
MNKTTLKLAVAGILLTTGMAGAEPLNVEWLLRGGLSWKGQLFGRDGDWIELKRPEDLKPVRVGANTIKELIFEIDLDIEKVSKMVKNREFEQVVATLEKAIDPFTEYSDIPSNLTKYNALLMELYYRTAQYDKSLAISSKIAEDDRNPELQEKSRVYQALALIDGGKPSEADALLAKYGWDQELSGDASPQKLYIAAKLMALKKQYSEAMLLIARVIAFNSSDLEWMQPAEMLCAEIYTELGLYDSAEEVCRQIDVLYKDSPEFDQAQQLKLKIEKLRAEQELEESLESKEA